MKISKEEMVNDIKITKQEIEEHLCSDTMENILDKMYEAESNCIFEISNQIKD